MKCESCGHENIQGARFCASCGVQLPTDGPNEGWIGKLIGDRFRVTRVLGEGGMGVVYAAEQQMGSTVRKVAIKTLHAHLSHDPSILARFHRECGTVAELEHPNTIKVYDFGQTDDGTLYIAMEFVEGRALDVIIAEAGALPPERVVRILEQVAGALDEAHSKGIVHRDLKPENVVLGTRLGKPDFVKVLDFGIAARRESSDAAKERKLTQQGMVLGTPPYMSPEQFTGQELDRRSDIYSLGIMTYEMLTGRLPFEAETPWQWATEHMTAQPFPIEQTPNGKGIPAPMVAVVMRSLAKRPEDRYDTAGEFVQELKASIGGDQAALSVARTELVGAMPRSQVQPASFAERGSTGTEHAISATQDFAIPGERKGGLGWVVGLSVLLVAGGAGAFFAWGGDGATSAGAGGGLTNTVAGPEPEATGGGPEASGSGGAESSSGGSPVSQSPTTAPAAGGAKATTSGSTSTKPTTPSTTPASTPQTKPVETKPVETKPPETKPVETKPPEIKPDPGPSCDSCRTLADAGKWSQATAAYGACDAKGKSACTAVASRAASSQVKDAGTDCAKIRSIVSGAKGVGVSVKRLDEAAASCK
jgi:serine/threonine protein kinase